MFDVLDEGLEEEFAILLNSANIWDKTSELITLQRQWNPETPAQNLFWPVTSNHGCDEEIE